MVENTSGGDFLAGVVVGALVGAAAALLFAPRSGEETRALIREKGIEIQERADEASVEARKRAEELSAQTRQTAAEWQAKVMQAVEEGKLAGTQKKEDMLSELNAEDATEDVEVVEVEAVTDEPADAT